MPWLLRQISPAVYLPWGGTRSPATLFYLSPQESTQGDFIKEFTDFLSDFITSYDHLLILGDFNIGVCCPDRPLVKEIFHIIDSFGLVQHINQPTHILGHTLDLILSYGFSVGNVFIEDAFFSDHKPIVFNVNLPNPLSLFSLHQLSHCLSPL